MLTSEAVTHGIRVKAASSYLEARSDPDHALWFFAYRIRIANEGGETVQLISRHWKIMDAEGRVEEVRGLGVVGEQPVLAPGESFEYTSGCPLSTPFGSMQGAYQMATESGERFNAEIAAFNLSQPHALH